MKQFKCIIRTELPHLIFDAYPIVHISDPEKARFMYESIYAHYNDNLNDCIITFNPGCRVNFDRDNGTIYSDSIINLHKDDSDPKYPWVGHIIVNAESEEALKEFLKDQFTFTCYLVLE